MGGARLLHPRLHMRAGQRPLVLLQAREGGGLAVCCALAAVRRRCLGRTQVLHGGLRLPGHERVLVDVHSVSRGAHAGGGAAAAIPARSINAAAHASIDIDVPDLDHSSERSIHVGDRRRQRRQRRQLVRSFGPGAGGGKLPCP